MFPNCYEPKSLADCMLGKLVRWLTILGYDARCGHYCWAGTYVENALNKLRRMGF